MTSQYEIEEETRQQLLKLEEEFRDYYQCSLKEFKMQMEYSDRLSCLATRFLILSDPTGCCKDPDIHTSASEDIVLGEYHEKYKLLFASNARLAINLEKLRSSCRAFEALCELLDMSVESPFILGDAFHKPIVFFIELVCDLFKYMHALLLKLRCYASLLDPSDVKTIAVYKPLLQPSEEFEEYLMMGLTYCKCLKRKPICRETKTSIFCPETAEFQERNNKKKGH